MQAYSIWCLMQLNIVNRRPLGNTYCACAKYSHCLVSIVLIHIPKITSSCSSASAQNKFYQWSQIHPQYYAFAFTAQGKTSAWCPVCYTDGGIHSYDCPKFALPPPNVYRPQRPTPYAQQFTMRPQAPTGPPAPKRSKPEHCILYNKYNGTCPFGDKCKYVHKCAHCGEQGHPVPSCPIKRKTYY